MHSNMEPEVVVSSDVLNDYIGCVTVWNEAGIEAKACAFYGASIYTIRTTS